MYDLLSSDDLQNLASQTSEQFLSLYMPTYSSGPEVQQNAIRFKNLMSRAEDQLQQVHGDLSLLKAIESKIDEMTFWSHQAEGLAIFASSQDVQFIKLPGRVDESVDIGTRPMIKPMLCQSFMASPFFLVCITWNQAALMRATRQEMAIANESKFPVTYDDVILARDPEVQLQFTSHKVASSPGRGTAMFHGQGEGESKIEADRASYLSIVGKLVADEIYNIDLPIVLVATEEVAGEFLAHSDVEIHGSVTGSPAELDDAEILDHASQSLVGRHQASVAEDLERFGTALANSKATENLTETLVAAVNGRIETLFLMSNANLYGTLSQDRTTVKVDESKSASNTELLNLAALETIKAGGKVIVLDGGDMPGVETPIAAIFRY
jgi:hypothetical protein